MNLAFMLKVEGKIKVVKPLEFHSDNPFTDCLIQKKCTLSKQVSLRDKRRQRER